MRGPITWVTVNPGAQTIGSFHPITEGDWTEGACIFIHIRNVFSHNWEMGSKGRGKYVDFTGSFCYSFHYGFIFLNIFFLLFLKYNRY